MPLSKDSLVILLATTLSSLREGEISLILKGFPPKILVLKIDNFRITLPCPYFLTALFFKSNTMEAFTLLLL